MIDAIATGVGQLWAQLEAWLFGLVSSAWALPTLFASTAADGLFPPVPGETVVITLAVGAQSGTGPALAVVLAVAALGAWCGDQVAFSLGRLVGTRRVPFLRGERGRRAVERAAASLDRNGASVVLAARFIPVGRTAVSVTAGAVGYSRRRFMVLSAAASAAWSVYTVLIGMVAGRQLAEQPLLAVVVGVVSGTVLGVVVDRTVRTVQAVRASRRRPAPRPAAVVTEGAVPEAVSARTAGMPSFSGTTPGA